MRMIARANSTNVELIDIAKLGKEGFKTFCSTVLRSCFPAAELYDSDVLCQRYTAASAGFPSLFASAGGIPIGGVLGEFDMHSKTLLVGYLAVAESYRGYGLGRRLIRAAISAWRTEFQPISILVEIEDPRYHASSRFSDPAARIRFYDRLGARYLPIPYFQPALRPSAPRVRNMLIVCLDQNRNTIPSPVILRFLDANIESCKGRATRRSDPEYLNLREQTIAHGHVIPLIPLRNLATFH